MIVDPTPYTGPFVTLRGEGIGWAVAIEPCLPTGEGAPRHFASKHDAFGECRRLWVRHKLPFTDFTNGNIARADLDSEAE